MMPNSEPQPAFVQVLSIALLASGVHGNEPFLEHRLVQLLNPCENACTNLTRFGRDLDGGYLMCADVLTAPHGLKGALSLGIKGRDSWGIAISQSLGVPIYEFDCFTTKAPEALEGSDLHFKPTCVGPRNEVRRGRQYASLATLIAQHASSHPKAVDGANSTSSHQHGHHSPEVDDEFEQSSLLLKMDVEGEEWAIFAAVSHGALSRLRQITFEIHGLTNDGEACRRRPPSGRRECWRLGGVHNISETVAFLEKLDRQFVLVSNHGNNWWGAHKIDGRIVPDLTELTFIHRKALPSDFRCAPLDPTKINQHHKPNVLGAPEIQTLAEWTGARQGFGRRS